jgi:2C-methyl-D-erythritol 2,4-cyclodiphosphate synthase
MPIEIKELHIKAVVGASDKGAGGTLKPEELNKLKKEISKEVMEKILRELKKKAER